MDDATESSKRLRKALSGISSEEMDSIRSSVNEEIKQVKIPSSSPPPTTIPSAPFGGNAADLNRTGEIAENFMAGLDHMSDVLMLLVMKFGRASRMVRFVTYGLLLSNVLLVFNLLFSWHLSHSQSAIQEEQVKIQRQQTQILNRQASTERVAGEAMVLATAAERAATEVKESAPSVVVDAKGRPQLILKVKDGEGEGTTKTVDPKRSTLKSDGNLQTPVAF